METNQKLTITYYLNKQRANQDLVPIYVKIYVDGSRAVFATPHKVREKDWNSKQQRVKSVGSKSGTINAYLDRTSSHLNTIFTNAQITGTIITSLQLKNKLLGKTDVVKEERTLKDAFDYHNLKMKEKLDAELIHPKSYSRYVNTSNQLEVFTLLNYQKSSLNLKELKMSFIIEFEHYLLTRLKLHPNTARRYLKNLKKVTRFAVELEWMDRSPFEQFKCTYKPTQRIVLSEEELERLQAKEFVMERLDAARDVFIFCCYTGFSYSDVFALPLNAVTKGIDGGNWITTNRQKTGVRESVPLLPPAMEIINKYQDNHLCQLKNKLLPVITNQRYNGYLKEIADICEINKPLTSHIARHTFATTVTLSNGVPIETVSKMLGHTKLATTQIYAKVLDTKVSHDMEKLKSILQAKEGVAKGKNKTA